MYEECVSRGPRRGPRCQPALRLTAPLEAPLAGGQAGGRAGGRAGGGSVAVLNLAPQPVEFCLPFRSPAFCRALLHTFSPDATPPRPPLTHYLASPVSPTLPRPPPPSLLPLFWTLMSRPLRQCGLCLQAVRAGTLPTGTLNGTN